MKLRVYFKPVIPVLLLGAVAAVFWCAFTILGTGWRLLPLPFALFYSALFVIGLWCLWRIARLERPMRWDQPRRLLILSPHEDDCTIGAGGIGVRNARLGGATCVAYLAPDETPGMAEVRAREAIAAWQLAGVPDSSLQRFDLLPPLLQHDPSKLRAAAAALRSIIDRFEPAVVIVPMFEGGHVHHDATSALLDEVVRDGDRFEIYEAPEYSPYTSLVYTPHRIVALCARWLLGLVSYYGVPDGVDGRSVNKVVLDAAELDCKRRMLAAFASQNGASLSRTSCYPDRLVRWQRSKGRTTPFDFTRSYLRFVLWARRIVPARIVDRLLPVQLGTIGRPDAITDWRHEWSPAADPIRAHKM
jgi:LmbE family N-acetylglucosaminyl deacetylase